MKKTTNQMRLTVLFLCLLVAMLFSFAACKDEPKGLWDDALYTEATTLGEGAKTVTVTVEAEDKSVVLTVKSDEETVGAALMALDLIEGEESQYGLYVKYVNGILSDYDVDGTYWAFYKNGEYQMTGVDTTSFADGDTVKLVRTK